MNRCEFVSVAVLLAGGCLYADEFLDRVKQIEAMAKPVVPADDPFIPKRIDPNDYAACKSESIRTGKHLVAWVGYKCISSERQVKDVIHCFVSEGDYSWATTQGVIVGVPRNGELWVQAEIPANEVCALSIRQGCAGTYAPGRLSGAQVRASGG